MLIWAVSSFLQIFCQHVLLAQNSVCVLSLGYEFVARRCKTYKGLEWLQLNPLFWPVSQTVLSCTHAAVRDFFFHRRQYDNRATVVEWTNSFVSLCMCRMNWHLFFRFQFNSHYSIIFDSLKVFLCYVLPVKSGVPRVLSPTSHTTVFFSSKKKIIESRWNTDAKSIFPIEFAIGFNRNHNRKTKRLTNSHTDFHLSFNMFPTRTNVSGIGVACHSLFFT